MSTHPVQLNVPLSFNQLFELARQLSPKEKIRLGSMLWDDTDEADVNIPEEHRKEVMRRIEKLEQHPESCLTWEDIESRIRL
jgi:putative addiction module component (TIGR02574 family)